jgi:hypothetical protein
VRNWSKCKTTEQPRVHSLRPCIYAIRFIWRLHVSTRPIRKTTFEVYRQEPNPIRK